MKAEFDVLWTAAAEDDLHRIIEFISVEQPEAAMEILKRIKEAAGELDQFPGTGLIVSALLMQGISRYREMVIKPWRLIYRIQDRKVYVVTLIDGRRNVEDILLSRLLNNAEIA